MDADTVKTDPTADGVLKNDGFVASAAEVLWNYMDYYDTNRLKKQTESAGVTVKKIYLIFRTATNIIFLIFIIPKMPQKSCR